MSVAPLVINHLYSIGQQLMAEEVKLYESSECLKRSKYHAIESVLQFKGNRKVVILAG